MSSLLVVFAVLTLGALTRSALGFGDALIAMPLLALTLGIRTATPLSALVSTTIAIAILAGDWRKADIRATGRLIVATIVGIPIGLIFLTRVPEQVINALLGILLIGFGVFSLFTPRMPYLHWRGFAYLFGFVAGIIGGAYNTNGPPIVIYGSLRRWSAERFRATMQGYFLPTGVLILIGHGLSGLWTVEVFRYYLTAVPGVLVGVYLGGKVNHLLAGRGFDKVVYLALVVFGLALLFG
jgi:uncharacterized membrane protein YfcA